MANRIRSITLINHSVVPAEVDVRVVVTTDLFTPTTTLRGRFLGPRCLFAETIEVAYPFRLISSNPKMNQFIARAIIPEASLWEPTSPHLYIAQVELWQDNFCVEQIALRHGLRVVMASPRGLRLNGQPITLKGRAVHSLAESDALILRRSGYNLLLASVTQESAFLWELADRVGFLVLGQPEEEMSAALQTELGTHPSCLGWISLGGFSLQPSSQGQSIHFADGDLLGVVE